MDRGVYVYLDLSGQPLCIGRLWEHVRGRRANSSFAYDPEWLSHPDRFALEPALTLGPGSHHSEIGHSLFGSLADSSPDRWGRNLMRRAERQRAAVAGETPRALSELDFLLGVTDFARQGALRFANQLGGPFLADSGPQAIPPIVELPQLLAAADRVQSHANYDQSLALLLAPGSSLGGARPKASVKGTNSSLIMAKFPKHDDETDVTRWEAVALTLAAQARIEVPRWEVKSVASRSVLLLHRFDRRGTQRIPFLSAMALLAAEAGEQRSYLEIAEEIRRHGAFPQRDLQALWRRIVFNILISNTDDHLRNHGVLYAGPRGWTLSPAYDLNPVPTDVRPRILSTAIDLDDATAAIDLALEVSPFFELDGSEATTVAKQVGGAVDSWSTTAKRMGLSKDEIDRMASAFEHDDLKAIRRMAS